jgi:hypothetical protein
MTKINITIPQPCHENWEGMSAVDKGRFCDSCQKKVFDFTSSSDREIINAFEKNHNLCGRFLNTQLDRDLIKPEKKSTLWLATTTALISLIGLNETAAQEPVKTEQRQNDILGKVAPPKMLNPEIEISGIVTDTLGNPLPATNILIKGTSIGTQADLEGKYSIRAKKGDSLVFNFIGFADQIFLITKETRTINVEMKEAQISLQGDVLVLKKRTFIGRLLHKNKYRFP